MPLNTEGLKKFTELDAKKAELEIELARIKKEMEAIAPAIMESMASEGVANIKINDRTVFTKLTIFAQISSKADAIKALKEAGMEDFITEGYNTNSISAFVRELTKNDEELPEAFGNAITAGEKVTLHSVKAG